MHGLHSVSDILCRPSLAHLRNEKISTHRTLLRPVESR